MSYDEHAETAYAEMPKSPMPQHDTGTIEHLSEACSYLHDRIELMAHRLESVLGPDFPTAAPEDSRGPARIQALTSEVSRAASRLDGLIARLVL